MRHITTACVGAALAILLCAGTLRAQNGSFDLEAYRQYLADHVDMTGSDLLTQHPAPLLEARASQTPVAPAFLDSVSLKYRLTADELQLIGQHGFMVTERLAPQTFELAFVDIWEKDLPVYISSDAVLHAVHLSYDRILMDLEEQRFIGDIMNVLEKLRAEQVLLEQSYGSLPGMQAPLRDVDVYLTVAQTLLEGYGETFYAETRAEVDGLLQHVRDGGIANIPLFSSTPRIFDFSQFTIRGHYSRSAWLGQYFQAMIWLGRTEFMLTSPVQQGVPEQKEEDIQRQIIGTTLLVEAIERSGAEDILRDMDALLASLVGESDNVKPAHIREVLTGAGVVDAASLLDLQRVADFQRVLAEKPFAAQRINSQILMSDPSSPEQLQPPSAFLLMGQRFIIDSYVFMNVVYDRIMYQNRKVMRMLPSTMDVLFALGNDAAAQFLQDDLAQFPYASNLDALRYLIDSHDAEFWNSSLYNSWLHAIRALNIPGDIDGLPPFMRTAAWWQQKMNTQLASWAQLRHDNLLYAKPSYTGGAGCSFPRAYVEPVPEFFARLSAFARNAAAVFGDEKLDLQSAYFTRFAAVMDTLESIAGKELSGEPLTSEEADFATGMLYRVPDCVPHFDGWYPQLLYGVVQSEPRDIVTADVHTAPTDAAGNFVGWVVHAGTGALNTCVVVAPTGDGGHTAFVGPVLSYYEHTTVNFTRLNDEEWRKSIDEQPFPRPLWTNNYLADAEGRRRDAGPSLLTRLTSVPAVREQHPVPATLEAAHPNPAGAEGTVLRVVAHRATPMRVSVFDISGRLITTLADRLVPAGTYVLRWDGRDATGADAPSGVYVIALEHDAGRRAQRMVLNR